jgi:hypothetical protein
MKQSKNSVLTFEIMYAMFKQVMKMLIGIFGQAVLGFLNVHATETAPAVGQQWVASRRRFWSQDKL